jgi:formate dehydrogenase subunit delta
MSHPLTPEARMGNDIARQFAHLSKDEATTTIAAHIARFWSPAMRQRLVTLARAEDSSLDPLLAAASAKI